MPQEIVSQFDRKFAAPIEINRQVATIAQRNAIPSGVRWEGMLVYVTTDQANYQLIGGLTDAFWQDVKDVWNATIINNLNSNSTTDALSANMGKTLNESKLSSVQAGTNITIDNTDPVNPIINAAGGGAVTSVFSRTGAVVAVAGDYGAFYLRKDIATNKTAGSLIMNNGIQLALGTSSQHRIQHDATNGLWDMYTGNLLIRDNTTTRFTFTRTTGTFTASGPIVATGLLQANGNVVEINGTSPRVRYLESGAGGSDWNTLVDGDNFDIRYNGVANVGLRILNSNGNVKIGSGTPAAKLDVDGDGLMKSLAFAPSASVQNANTFTTFMPIADSILADSVTTSSTNWAAEFGEFLMIRGATTNRSFALFKNNGDNSVFSIGNYNAGLADWEWRLLMHEDVTTPRFRGIDSVILTLEADTDNVGEGGHPAIIFSQDGALVQYRIGLGDTDGDTGPQGNSLVLSAFSGSTDSNFYWSPNNGTNNYKVWTEGNDGAGSGLDADLLAGRPITESGNRWGVYTYIATTGVMEIGKYIDFHNTDGSTGDHDGRITLTGANAWTFSGTVTATNFILSSDKRKKRVIQDIVQPHFAKGVRWRRFTMKGDRQTRYGVIAQELEQSHPEFVMTDDEGFKSVLYIDLLVNKIAELESRMKILERAL